METSTSSCARASGRCSHQAAAPPAAAQARTSRRRRRESMETGPLPGSVPVRGSIPGRHDNRAMTTSSLVLGAPVAVRLTDWGVIRAKGEDAASFLNGQLTQETLGLEPGQARLAGYCSPKGRLLASFVMWRGAPDEILLACSADLLAA